jgi:hypothetical protein
LFDRFEDQLRDAAQAQVAARGHRLVARRVSGWLRAGGRAAPVAIAVATTVAIAVVALVLVHHGGAGTASPGAGLPGLDSPQATRDFKYIRAATLSTQRSAVCRARGAQPPAVIRGAPGAALTSSLAVLRRAASAADRLPPHAVEGTDGVYAGAARRARVLHGATYYLVPVRVYPDAGQPTPRCLDAQLAAVRRALPSIPAEDRGSTAAFERALVAFDRRLISAPQSDGLCLVSHSRTAGSQECGITPAQLRTGVLEGSDNGRTDSGIVPDGVASVTLRFPASRDGPARAVTGAVVGNVWVVSDPSPAEGNPIVVWRAADGRTVHTINPPSRAQAVAACRQDPIECLAVSGASASGGGSSSGASSSSSSASATTASATTPRSR